MELIIANCPWGVLSVYLDDKGSIIEVQTTDKLDSEVNSIYVARVEQIKKNINSAFVRINDGPKVFLSLENQSKFLYTKKIGQSNQLTQGDELLVQIEKEVHKTKLAKGTGALVLSGRYVILTTDKNKLFVSSKISESEGRLAFKSKLRGYVTSDYGFIVRTNAKHVSIDLVIEEIKSLSKTFESIVKGLAFKKAFQKLYTPLPTYLSMIRDLTTYSDLKIIIDDEGLLSRVSDYMTLNGLHAKIHYFDATKGENLLKAYSIRAKLTKLNSRKVWLKSGATIVIEPTEAMIVIDVNTEKTLSRKNVGETLLKTNMEAADMIIYQMQARNMSGIIVIDFIDMLSQEDKETLMTYFTKQCTRASRKTTVHGMTHLGLVEVTRKKVEKPIWENNYIQNLIEN